MLYLFSVSVSVFSIWLHWCVSYFSNLTKSLFSCHCNTSPLFSCRNACRLAGISLRLFFRGGLAHSLWLIGLSSCQLAAGYAWLPLLLIKCLCVNLLMSRALDSMEHPQGNQPHLKGLCLSQNWWINQRLFICITHSSNTAITHSFPFSLLLYFSTPTKCH